ncbi:fungal-specific transcription factor domain-containing protein [Penicillium pulvis]|uniref:fungal-specific transcription factor domain-containing protein n=1 Tax=Penicillium pulvis TaxID=1562058 RepID=UPI002548A36C|nr:fungal-specific transcription factor domain-containing protein [Penicillium pulvis]KAJ5786953.1 fungal-specific transcription factor domain-containing protein [Penicillium pulvis]
MSEFKPYENFPEDVPYTERQILHSIENDLMTIKQDTTSLIGTNPVEDVDYGSKMSQLYRLAGLIYFERVLKGSFTDQRVAGWSDEAFDIIRHM